MPYIHGVFGYVRTLSDPCFGAQTCYVSLKPEVNWVLLDLSQLWKLTSGEGL